jgi:hypothetical protein
MVPRVGTPKVALLFPETPDQIVVPFGANIDEVKFNPVPEIDTEAVPVGPSDWCRG